MKRTVRLGSNLGRLGLVGCSVILLAACSSSKYRDRNSDYYLAEAKINPLPPEFQQLDAMPLEPTQPLNKAQKRIPRPEAQLSYTEPEQLVQLREDAQGESWLLANRSPAEVWPALRVFAATNELATLASRPTQGQLILQLPTQQPEASQLGSLLAYRQAYQQQDEQQESQQAQDLTDEKIQPVKPAVERKQLEIHLRQGVRQASSEIRLNNPDYLEPIQSFLQQQLLSNNAGVSMQAQSLQTQHQVYLQDRDERQVLVLELGYARAWSELTYLLEEEAKSRSWLALTDYNRDAGRVYLQYIPKEKRLGGFFSRLFKPSPKLKNYNYQLVLNSYAQELDLVVETAAGVAAPAEIEQEILAWLEHQLR